MTVVMLLVVGLMPAWAMTEARQAVCEEVVQGAFRDVAAGSTHAANIDCVAGIGIARGVGDGDYAPGRTVIRAQMATFLVQLVEVAGDHTIDLTSGQAPFEDIDGSVHERNIRVAAHLGITSGRTVTSFDPLAPVTRGQMATFVVQALEVAGANLSGAAAVDAFDDDDGTMHERNINTLAAIEVISGIGGRQYAPRGHVTRAQMATFLVNAAAYLHKHDLWAPLDDVTTPPRMLSVRRSNADNDSAIDVRWNRVVELVGGPADFLVYDADDETLVATGTTAVADGHTTTVVLDVPLVVGTTYHLRATDGVVVDVRDLLSVAQSVMFVWAADSGTDDADGPEIRTLTVNSKVVEPGDAVAIDADLPVDIAGTVSALEGRSVGVRVRPVGNGSWQDSDVLGPNSSGLFSFRTVIDGLSEGAHSIELQASDSHGRRSGAVSFSLHVNRLGQTVLQVNHVAASVETSMLVVSFNQPVNCPDSGVSRASWSFSNLSSRASAESASGQPDRLQQTGLDSNQCGLVYQTLPISVADHGVISYAQPADQSSRIVSQIGDHLSSFSGQIVVDTAPVILADLVPNTVDDSITLMFNKPVQCAGLSVSDFSISVNLNTVEATGVSCVGLAESNPRIFLEHGAIVPADWVIVDILGDMVSESGRTSLAGTTQVSGPAIN